MVTFYPTIQTSEIYPAPSSFILSYSLSLPPVSEVVGKQCFQSCLSVILFTGGGCTWTPGHVEHVHHVTHIVYEWAVGNEENANIANFILAVPLEIDKNNEFHNLQM